MKDTNWKKSNPERRNKDWEIIYLPRRWYAFVVVATLVLEPGRGNHVDTISNFLPDPIVRERLLSFLRMLLSCSWIDHHAFVLNWRGRGKTWRRPEGERFCAASFLTVRGLPGSRSVSGQTSVTEQNQKQWYFTKARKNFKVIAQKKRGRERKRERQDK